MNYKTNNFLTSDLVHTDWDSFPKKLLPIAYNAQGYVQCLRNALNVPLIITSGFRSAGYNATIKGASPNSHHVWRYDGDRLVWAVDIASPKLSAEELFKRVKDLVVGECYLHRTMQFVHISPQIKDETWVV